MRTIVKLSVSMAIMFLALISNLSAQQAQSGGLDEETLKKANNPLASTKSVNVHNYVMPSLHGVPDASLNQLIFRYAHPIGNFLLRASLPIVTTSGIGVGPTTGLGDASIFGIYSFSVGKGIQLGVGPSLTFPTGTNHLGAGKWQAGASALIFIARSPFLQIGSLVQWQMSFAGDDSRANVNLLTPQLFFIWQLGRGTYLRSTGAWSFDLNSGNYNIPLGLGIGQVVKVNNVVFNLFAEPQFSVAAKGVGQPKFQVFVGFNTQF